MADELEQKIIFSAESKLGPVKQELLDLNQTLTDQLTVQKKLALQGKQNSEAYIDISSKVRLTKQAIRDSNREFDNAVKAINSASNSIKQNRALLSTLNAEYIKMAQVEGQVSPATLKLKSNIEQLTATLKEQEKQIGLTNRNVGNYHDSIVSALSGLIGNIPGLQQFTGATQAATKIMGFMPTAINKASGAMTSMFGGGNPGRNVIQGFGQMSQSSAAAAEEIEKVAPAAAEAEAGITALAPAEAEAAGGMVAVTAASGGLAVAFIALIGALAAGYEWFKRLGSEGIKFEQIINGAKDSAVAMINSMQNGDSFEQVAANMKKAYNGGVELKKGMQELAYAQQAADLKESDIQRQIDLNMITLRSKQITLDEAKRIAAETSALDKKLVDEKQTNIRKEYALAVEQGINAKDKGEEEKDRLRKILYEGNQIRIQEAERTNNIDKGTAEKLEEISKRQIATMGERDMLEQKAANRMAIIQQRFGKAGAKLADESTKELAQARANIAEAEQGRLQSLSRQLQFTLSAYGKELEATDNHYRELIYKQMQFVAQQEKLARLAKDPEAKKLFTEAGKKGMLLISQLQSEWQTDLQSKFEDNRDKIYDLVTKSTEELQQSTIANIKNTEEKQVESLKLQQQIREDAYEKESIARSKEIYDLKIQAQTAAEDEKQSLLDRASALQTIQHNADKKRVQDAERTDQEILDVHKKTSRALQAWDDQVAIDTKRPGSRASFDAQKVQATDQADNAIEDATQTPDSTGMVENTAGIRQKYQDQITDIDKKANLDRRNFELQTTKEAADGALTIAKNAIQQQEQATITSLERQKTLELNNQSATNTQKAVIEAKYEKLEGQAKVKAFKENQEISALQAAINTALAVTMVTAQTGVLSEFVIPAIIAAGAVEIATILAQSPPAYATGGVHVGDGKVSGPGTGKSDSVNARLSNGEAVINAKSTSMFGPLLSAINQAGGGIAFANPKENPWVSPGYTPGFATGGIYLPTQDSGARMTPVSAQSTGPMRLHPDDINGIGAIVSNAVINMPAPIVDVKDVNYEQQKLANVQDRYNH